MTRPICITGMHRSGTSMVAHAAQALGLHLGDTDDLIPAAPDNPDGFFEHAGLVAASNALLEQLGAGWDCPPTLSSAGFDQPGLAVARELARPVIDELSAHGAWAWKDPRVAPVLPFWIDLIGDLGIVLCLRNPLEVAASLRARNGMSLALGLRLWFQHMDAVATSTAPRHVTHYDAWFHRPDDEIARLCAFAGIEPDAEQRAAAAAVPARHQRHARFDAPALRTARVHADLRDLYARLSAEAAWSDGATGIVLEPVTTNGTHSRPTSDERAIGHVQPMVVDVGVARYEVHKRNGRVAQLERLLAETVPSTTAAGTTTGEVGAATRTSEDLQSAIYDLQLSVAELTARVTNGIDAETRATDIAYARMIRGVRSAVRRVVPVDADVLVITEGEPALLDLHGRPARHFPVGVSPLAPGHHPASGIHAATHLVVQQALGATHLVVPSTGGWWLDAYGELADHLTRSATVLSKAADGSTILGLGSGSGASTEPERFATLDEALAAARRRLGHDPSALDATTGGLGGPTTFRPPDPAASLPYLDRSIDVVVVDADAGTSRQLDATRVSATGVVAGGPDGWTWSWTAPPPSVRADIVVAAAAVPDPRAYLDVFSSKLPLGHQGEITIVAPIGAVDAWRHASDDRFTVAMGSVGAALAHVADRSDVEHVVFVDGAAIPLDGWLTAMLDGFARSERVALVAGRRRMTDGTLIAAHAVEGDRMQATRGLEGDHLTRPIDIAVPGLTAWRRRALQAHPFADGFDTLEFVLADHCWALATDGLECVVRPDAETADLGLGGPPADELARDRGRLDRAWAVTS